MTHDVSSIGTPATRCSTLWLLVVVSLFHAASGSSSADTLRQSWALAPGDRPYVTGGNLERGIAYNPVSKNVLLLGRALGPTVYVLSSVDGSDGSETTGEPRALSPLDANGENAILGGTFTLNLVGVA
ncbi:MAG: hypothetical protein JNL97_14160, partial [Verrucomicrobiales bacterium]|nr:hypothetical protein [Verrucomicrobiales bacterium]